MKSAQIAILGGLAAATFGVTLALADAGPAPDSNKVWDDPALRAAAETRGAQVYGEHCASCHGADLKGVAGAHAPDLTDDYWLLGGEDLDTFQIHPSDVETTVRFGVRSGHPKGRELSSMPAWSAIAAKSDGLSGTDMDDVIEYVLHLSGQQADLTAALRGKHLFGGKATCFDCHASDAKGDSSIGAPDLTRPATWVYGSDRAAIRASVVEGRAAAMPAFADRLSDREIADVSIYVLARAGGRDF
jgi:cytochrome c oxidase cbb3-type subunit 3